MALPYDTLDPFAPGSPFAAMDPEMEAELLAQQEQAPAFDPAGFPATDPYIEELEAQLAAEQAPAPAPSSARIAELVQQQQAPIEPDLEAEIMGMAPQLAAPEIPAQYIGGLPELDGPAVAPEGGLEQPHALTEDGSRYDYSLQDFVEAPANPEYDEIAGDVDPALLTDTNLALRARDIQRAEDDERARLERERDAAAAQRKVERATAYEQALVRANAKTEDLVQQAQDHARQKIDKDRYVKDMSWGEKAAGFLSIIAGGQLGLLSGRGGNDALKFFMSEINRDIDEQKYNLETQAQNIDQQKGLVADMYRQAGNIYAAGEMASIAMFEASAAEIENQLAKLDPAGSQAVERELERRGMLAASAAHQAKLAEHNRKISMEEAELEIKAYDTQSQIDKRAVDAAATAKKAGLRQDENGNWVNDPRSGRGKKKPLSPAQQKSLIDGGYLPYLDANGMIQRDPNFTGKPIDPKAAAELVTAQAGAVAAERAIGAETLGAPGVVDSKGEPILFQDKDTAIEVAKGLGTTRFAVDVYDDLLLAIEKHGWSSDTLRSPEWQRANVNAGELTVLFKEMGKHGALSGSDIDLVNKQSGTQGDVTGVRDPTEGLLQARENLLKRQNHNIQALREDAQPIVIPRKKAPPKAEAKTPTERYEIVSAPVAPHLTDEAGLATDIANRKQVANEALSRVRGPGEKYLVAANFRQDLRKQVEAGTVPEEVAWSAVGDIMQEEAKVLARRVMSEYKDAKKAKDPGAAEILKRAEDLKWLGGGGGTPREAWAILNNEDNF